MTIDWSKIKTLSDLAAAGVSNRYQNLINTIDRSKQEWSVDDLNSMMNSVVQYTGSGRQGAGMKDLSSLYFDKNGNVLVDTITDRQSGDSFTNTINNTGGARFWNPPSESNGWLLDQETGKLFQESGQDNGSRQWYDPNENKDLLTWETLSNEQKQKILDNGLFENIKNVDAFTRTDKEWKAQGVDPNFLNDHIITRQELKSILPAAMNLNNQELSNVDRAPSNGWLGRNMTSALAPIGMLTGVPFLSIAGNVANTGQALKNGNVLGALTSAISAYNGAAGMASAAGTNIPKVNLTGKIGSMLGAQGKLAPVVGGGALSAIGASLSGGNPMLAGAQGALGQYAGQSGYGGLYQTLSPLINRMISNQRKPTGRA